jgi:putative flavoprotein involved in K+ transport
MKNHYPIIIVGGGQAGLSLSYCLKEKGFEHIVFEKNTIGYSWRSKRWDSFCLVTPNWQCKLPGYHYFGDEPEGFMQKDQIVQYIEDYAKSFAPPIKEGVEVLNVRSFQGGFAVTTTIGEYTADNVAIASGSYHRPKIPPLAQNLDKSIVQLHSSEYKNPQSLPDNVLVVGTGQSGCQIAEDLHLEGKKVHLCVGSASRSPRRYRGKDVVEWLDKMGHYDLPVDEHPQKEQVRAKTNHYVTGRDGGREIDLRQFALQGMQLYGSLNSVKNPYLQFRDNLQQNLDGADAVAENIKKNIDGFIDSNQIQAPVEPTYQPAWQPEATITQLDYKHADIGAVIWCTGYQSDFSWIEISVFDDKGYPKCDRGVTAIEGLYFLGLPWLYTWGSGRFSGIARDARYLSDRIAANQKINLFTLSS